MLEIIIIFLTLSFLTFGSYFDLKTSEIPEKVSIGLIVVISSISAVYSLYSLNFSYILNSLFTGILYFILGYIFFYLGEWGGGDVKIFTGIGCSLGFLKSLNFFNNGIFPCYIDYIINIGVVSLPYLMLYVLILGLIKRAVFKEFLESVKNPVVMFVILLSFIPFISANFYFKFNSNSIYLYLHK